MRKFISLFIAVCVAAGCLITNVVMAEDILQLSVSSVEAESGDSISIAVNVENNVNGISNFDMALTYDSEYLTYVNYTAGLYGGILVVNGTNPGEVKFSAADYKNSSGDGVIVYFNFSVNDTDEENVNTELNLTVDRICYIDSTYTVIAMENEVTAGSVLINKVDVTTTESTTATTTTTETTTESTTAATTTTETTTESTTAATTATETTTESTTAATTATTTTESTTESTTQSAEYDTETTTESATETTTEAVTETTTRKTTSSSGGHSSGAGASSLTVNGYTSTTTTEATTEATTEETVDDTEEEDDTTEETVNTVSTGVRVTIGSTTVIVNGESYEMDAAPYIQSASNSTLVPLRFVAIAIAGGNVESADNSSNIAWDASTKTAVITFDGKTIEFTAGSNVMVIDGTAQAMDNGVQAEITDGRMFVPFRALGEALGVSVEWDADTKTAIYN